MQVKNKKIPAFTLKYIDKIVRFFECAFIRAEKESNADTAG